MRRTAFGLILSSALTLGACDDDPNGPELTTLELTFQNLEPLAGGFHYEGWAIVDGAALPTGKFNVAAGGGLVTLSGSPIAGGAFDTGLDLEGTTAVVITIEPAGDTDAVPASTHVVAGSVSANGATLTVGHAAALGSDFAAAAGSYILATPTNSSSNDENSGIWFLTLASGSPAAGLSLPTLPAGWVYEGWAVIGGRPVTTGRFTSVSAADQSAPFSGPLAGPPFPGEDFLQAAPAGLTFPTNLAGGTAVISIEPEPDDSPAPFTLKPLAGPIPADAKDHVTYSIANNAAGFPTGSARIR